MDLLELSQWLQRQMKEKDIPRNAKISWMDVGECEPEGLDLEYDRESNTVTISQI